MAPKLDESLPDLGDLDRVREPRPVEVALVDDEDLRLVLEAAERLGVDHAVAVALVLGPLGVLRLRVTPPAAARAARAERCERAVLDRLERASVAKGQLP